jgi:hypothetical protein
MYEKIIDENLQHYLLIASQAWCTPSYQLEHPFGFSSFESKTESVSIEVVLSRYFYWG